MSATMLRTAVIFSVPCFPCGQCFVRANAYPRGVSLLQHLRTCTSKWPLQARSGRLLCSAMPRSEHVAERHLRLAHVNPSSSQQPFELKRVHAVRRDFRGALCHCLCCVWCCFKFIIFMLGCFYRFCCCFAVICVCQCAGESCEWWRTLCATRIIARNRNCSGCVAGTPK